jgi:hypothetical protein
MLFVPSIVFWPASVGKEALMQLAVGAMAWATSLLYNGRVSRALLPAVGGGLMLYLIRPHLLAILTVAAAVPYLFGRVRNAGTASFLGRPIATVLLGIMVVFTVVVGTKYVGIENLSLDSIEEQLDAQTEATAYGGSSYAHTGNSLTNPLYLPIGFATVIYRPFLVEAHNAFQLFAALEGTVLLWLTFHRRQSIMMAIRRCRREPFIGYCVLLILFYSVTFSSLANFGLLTRQRSLVLPALYALLAVSPGLLRNHIARREEEIPSVLNGYGRNPSVHDGELARREG